MFLQRPPNALTGVVLKPYALNIVMGVNDHLYNPKKHHLVTAASCTTNCLAPIVKVIQSEIGIEHGLITTIHDVTNTQTVVDKHHKDLRRARSSLMNLIPTSTGSATAIGLIFPELDEKLKKAALTDRAKRTVFQSFFTDVSASMGGKNDGSSEILDSLSNSS